MGRGLWGRLESYFRDRSRARKSYLGAEPRIRLIGGGGGSRTRVRKCYWSRDYMLIRVHAPGITLGRSRPTLRTDKKRVPLACRSRPLHPDVAEKTSPLCDVLRRPTGKTSSNGC